MIVTYKFNLPEENYLLAQFQQAMQMHRVIHDFHWNVKSRSSSLDDKQLEGYELAMKHFFNLVEENKVNVE